MLTLGTDSNLEGRKESLGLYIRERRFGSEKGVGACAWTKFIDASTEVPIEDWGVPAQNTGDSSEVVSENDALMFRMLTKLCNIGLR